MNWTLSAGSVRMKRTAPGRKANPPAPGLKIMSTPGATAAQWTMGPMNKDVAGSNPAWQTKQVWNEVLSDLVAPI